MYRKKGAPLSQHHPENEETLCPFRFYQDLRILPQGAQGDGRGAGNVLCLDLGGDHIGVYLYQIIELNT